MREKTVISSPTLNDLLQACEKFFFSSNITILENGAIFNKNGRMENYFVKYNGSTGRHQLKMYLTR